MFVYLGHWRWSADGAPEMTPAEQIGNLIQLDDDSGPISIPHYDVTKAHLTLGVWKSPAGNLEQRYLHLLNKSKTWTASMHAAPTLQSTEFSCQEKVCSHLDQISLAM